MWLHGILPIDWGILIINQVVQVTNPKINHSLPVDLKSGFPDNMGWTSLPVQALKWVACKYSNSLKLIVLSLTIFSAAFNALYILLLISWVCSHQSGSITCSWCDLYIRNRLYIFVIEK